MANNEDDYGLESEGDEGETATPAGPGLRAAASTLPIVMLEAALRGKLRRRFENERGIGVVIKAPASDWAAPLLGAAQALAPWEFAFSAITPERSKSREDFNNEQIIEALGSGRRVIGVSHAPDRFLPAPLFGPADITLDVPYPSDALVRIAIKAATGRAPSRMPKNIAAGLDYATICTCVRRGSTPGQCVARLVMASQSRFAGADDLAAVPELGALHGYGEAMDWAQRLIGDLEAWRRGEVFFGDIERAVVLASAPGFGKTTFVRSLARSSRLPLFVSSVGGWFSGGDGHLGDVIKQIDRLFAGANAVAPAIIFLDEIEALPDRRHLDGRNSDWWMPVIGHMLTTLDGASSGAASRLIIIGATNYPEKLDPALVRPGRLNRIIQIQPPDSAAMVGILRQHLGADLPEADLAKLAQMRIGATGAEASGWIKSARARARHEKRPLSVEDLVEQIAPTNDWPLNMIWRIAVHESSHAVIMQLLGLACVEAVSIASIGDAGGHTAVSFAKSLMTKKDSEEIIIFLLAGMCGEQVLLGASSSGAGGDESSDLARATKMVATTHASLGLGATLTHRGAPEDALRVLTLDPALMDNVEKDLRRLYARGIDIVTQNRDIIERVAHALVAERHLPGDRFREVFNKTGDVRTARIGGHHG